MNPFYFGFSVSSWPVFPPFMNYSTVLFNFSEPSVPAPHYFVRTCGYNSSWSVNPVFSDRNNYFAHDFDSGSFAFDGWGRSSVSLFASMTFPSQLGLGDMIGFLNINGGETKKEGSKGSSPEAQSA